VSLIPAFEIGLWNAWIFILLEVLTFPLFIRIAKGRAPEVEGKSQVSALSRTARITLYILCIPALKTGDGLALCGPPYHFNRFCCWRYSHIELGGQPPR
jgi:hypothetical protein